MKAQFVIDDSSWGHVEVALKALAVKVPRDAARTIRRAAIRMEKRAKELVPEATGTLMESFRLEESRGAGNRLVLRLVVGGEGTINLGGEIFNLDQYAALIHENYESVVTSGKYRGAGTMRKLESGIPVGGHFSTRAAAEEEPAMLRAAREAVTNVIKTEMGS